MYPLFSWSSKDQTDSANLHFEFPKYFEEARDYLLVIRLNGLRTSILKSHMGKLISGCPEGHWNTILAITEPAGSPHVEHRTHFSGNMKTFRSTLPENMSTTLLHEYTNFWHKD